MQFKCRILLDFNSFLQGFMFVLFTPKTNNTPFRIHFNEFL